MCLNDDSLRFLSLSASLYLLRMSIFSINVGCRIIKGLLTITITVVVVEDNKMVVKSKQNGSSSSLIKSVVGSSVPPWAGVDV
jgi:hypothetical protein